MSVDVLRYTHNVCCRGSLCTIHSAVMTCPVQFFFLSMPRLFAMSLVELRSFVTRAAFVRGSVLTPTAASRQVPAFVPTVSLCGKNCKNCTYSIFLSFKICIHKTALTLAFIIITVRRLSQLAMAGMCKWRKKSDSCTAESADRNKTVIQRKKKCAEWMYCM